MTLRDKINDIQLKIYKLREVQNNYIVDGTLFDDIERAISNLENQKDTLTEQWEQQEPLNDKQEEQVKDIVAKALAEQQKVFEAKMQKQNNAFYRMLNKRLKKLDGGK